MAKNPSANAGDKRDVGSIPGSGGSRGHPFQSSCWENPMDRGAWWATVHGVEKSWTPLRDFNFSSSLSRIKEYFSHRSKTCIPKKSSHMLYLFYR